MTRGSQFTRGILCRNILTVSLLSFKINLKLYSSHSLKFSSMSTIDIISWLYIGNVENFVWCGSALHAATLCVYKQEAMRLFLGATR